MLWIEARIGQLLFFALVKIYKNYHKLEESNMAGVTFTPETKTLKGAIIGNVSTDAEWKGLTKPIPANMMVFASDTKVIKVGDGVTMYNDLPVYYDPNGTVDLADILHVKFVADIAARDLIPENERTSLVYVYDASADEEVESGGAVYAYDSAKTQWVKFAEGELFDFKAEDYFNKTTDTADVINDGTTKVMMTTTERSQLADLIANAVKYTDTVIIQGFSATELEAALVNADAG